MAGLSAVGGVLVVDKPPGPTSHDIVAQARRLFGTRRIGHAGTLDPAASGVLLLLFGEATKLSPYLSLEKKRYQARIAFGRATDSLDAQGVTTDTQPLPAGGIQRAGLQAALEVERARRSQVPPAFSAIKVSGQRAHRLSRRGQNPTLGARDVSVFSLSLIELGTEHADLDLTVSKGYYVRALARDIGDALGIPTHLGQLRRTESGAFRLDDAVGWPPQEPRLLALAEAARRCLPVVTLTPEGTRRARLGQRLAHHDFAEDAALAHRTDRAAWLDQAGELVAVGKRADDDAFRVVRGFSSQAGGMPRDMSS